MSLGNSAIKRYMKDSLSSTIVLMIRLSVVAENKRERWPSYKQGKSSRQCITETPLTHTRGCRDAWDRTHKNLWADCNGRVANHPYWSCGTHFSHYSAEMGRRAWTARSIRLKVAEWKTTLIATDSNTNDTQPTSHSKCELGRTPANSEKQSIPYLIVDTLLYWRTAP